ncbi:MAG TPA: hypothetical protein VG838_11980 [Opitutaceae bacterium]|nr:hypothetical protein [Opitutaceae bacterium]
MKWLKGEAFGTAAIVAGIVWIYVFIAGGYDGQPYGFSRQSVRYYHLLADGFLAGRTSLLLEPPPELAKMADPYDPVQRGDLGIHDGTYYKGRYYLYFGVGPEVALFLPFRVLTGVHFSENLGVGLFCAGGYVCAVALFLGLRRRFFPAVTQGWVWLGTLTLGLANFCPVMLVRSDFWEVPIAGAYFFSSLGLLLLWRGTNEATRDRRWFWLASGAFGLAVASRPHFLFATAVLGFVWLWRRRDGAGAEPGARQAAADRDARALFLPFAAIVVGLLVYNYQRFDDPLEFGQKYQIGGVSMRHFSVLNGSFIPINFYFNFLAPAQFQRYFPFVDVIRGHAGVPPVNYLGFENPYGVLPGLPVVWLALLAPAAWWAGRRAALLGRWLLLLGWHFVAVAGMVLLFGGATNRYMVDFLPSALLLAGLGLLALGEVTRRRPRLRRALLAGAAGLAVYSSAFTLCAAVQYNGLFQRQHPALYARLARWCNAPVFAWERWRPPAYGPLELTVTFPKDQRGKPQPLVITGAAFHSDYLYVVYDALGQSIRLAYDRTNHEHAASQAIPVDYNVPHRIGVESGALYPPVDNPFFHGWSGDAIRRAKTTLRVTVDGVPFLEGEHDFFDATPGQVSVGTNPLSDNGGRQFTGRILSAERRPLPPAVDNFSGGGLLALAIKLRAESVGRSEPLVATGRNGRGDLLFVNYPDPGHIRLGFHHAGEPPLLSAPIDVDPAAVQLLEVSFGSFYRSPRTTRERELASMLVVRCNTRTIWLEARPFEPAEGPPAIGANLWGSDACAGRFSGQIVGQHAVAAPASADSPFAIEPYWLEVGAAPRWGPVRLRLKLPADQLGKVEPLIVTGASAATGDYVWINYPAAGQLLLGYEHTGAGGPHTGLLPVDYGQTQVLEISLPSFYPPDTSDYFAWRPLREVQWRTTQAQLRLNGAVGFEAKVPAYEAQPEEVTFGENRISPAFGKKFSGQILSIERGSLGPPPGLDANPGPLEMTVTLAAAVGGPEVLLATGQSGGPDLLLVSRLDARHLRFSVRTAAGKSLDGKIAEADPAVKHRVQIRWGGLYPDRLVESAGLAGRRKELQEAVTVELDGQTVLAGQPGFQQASPQYVQLGGASAVGRPFSGLIHDVRRLDR